MFKLILKHVSQITMLTGIGNVVNFQSLGWSCFTAVWYACGLSCQVNYISHRQRLFNFQNGGR